MSATNAAALTAEPTTPKAMPDFSHRLAYDYEPNCPNALVFDVETMLDRSKGILSLIQDLHLSKQGVQINHDNIVWALGSVINELSDIFALVEAYHGSVKANQQA
jgi:hypothetical protein